MESGETRFLAEFQVFSRQVAEVAQYWHGASTLDERAKASKACLRALNLTPTFWRTAKLAMEQQAILAAAKIFGPRRTNPHNIDALFHVLKETRAEVFSREALEARKRCESANASEWIDAFMKHVRTPAETEVRHLQRLSRQHRRTYDEQYAGIRNRYIAHYELVDPEERQSVFHRTRIRDFEHLIRFVSQLERALWQTFHNGRALRLRPTRYSTRSMAASKLKDLRETPNHEHIVAEARMCLALLTRGATAMPDVTRENLRWGAPRRPARRPAARGR